MKCPFCKYEPKYKQDGNVRSGQEDFTELCVEVLNETLYVIPRVSMSREIFACPKYCMVFMQKRKVETFEWKD